MVKYDGDCVVGNEQADCLIPRDRKPSQERSVDKPVLLREGYLIEKFGAQITHQTDFDDLNLGDSDESHVRCQKKKVSKAMNSGKAGMTKAEKGLISASSILSIKPRRSLFFFKAPKLLVYLCLLGGLFCYSHAAQVIRTKQDLPSSCYERLKTKDCPDKSFVEKDWEELNSTCCAGFAGTALHCQVMKNGSNFPACLPEQFVEAGKAGQLTVDSAGRPEFITDQCEPHTYQSQASVSSNLKFPYCPHIKINCRGKGMVLLCSGGSTADDICTCGHGFHPDGQDCFGVITKDNFCSCEPLICPDGQEGVRIPAAIHNLSCNEVQFRPQFSCVNVTDAPTSTPPSSESTKAQTIDTTGIDHQPIDNSSILQTNDVAGKVHHFVFSCMALYICGLGGLVYLRRRLAVVLI